MHEINIPGLDEVAIERLMWRAEGHGWTVQEEVKYLLTRGLDALKYAERVFRDMAEAADRPTPPQIDATVHRPKIEQILRESSARDAKALEELDQLFGDLNPRQERP
jgi:plasmid stability protein